MVPPELLNNLAVLQLEAGNLADAKVLLSEALENCEVLLKQQQDDRIKALRISIKFNQAWCWESSSEIRLASETYKCIIREEPTYTDAYLRLSLLSKMRGDVTESLAYVDNALQNHIKKTGYALPTNVICFKAMLLEQYGMGKESFAQFQQAKEMTKGQDSYARVGLANSSYCISTLRRADSTN